MKDETYILFAIEQGDAHTAEQLVPLVYDDLRKVAAVRLAREKPGQTRPVRSVKPTPRSPTGWLRSEADGAVLAGERGPILDAGPARFLTLGDDKKVKTVIDLTRYGVVVP